MTRSVVRTIVAAISLLAPYAICAGEPAGGSRPNIIVILADDLGFSDLGCYGGEIQTPHLDRLATAGLRFSQFYNCALCGPSRAALMTGQHPHRVGITAWTGLLNDRCVTLFELFKRAGYRTGATGRLDMITAEKWHDPENITKYVDRYLGSTGHTGPGNHFKDVHNTPFYRDGQPFRLPETNGYKTDVITTFAEEFINEAARGSQPFLLYIAHYAPHWPLHAKESDIAKYREMYRTLGWDEARMQRHRRLLDMGLIPGGTKLSPRDIRAAAWEDTMSKDWEAERMAVFAAQVDALDQSVGRVMDTLHRTGADLNTLVLFLSDNGASHQPMNAQLDKPRQTWRVDGIPTRVGNKPDIWPGPPENFVTAGPAWANVSNTPFRQHKQSNFEGGIAAPLIAWWPGVIRNAGAITSELSHITDITATCLDAAGIAYPTVFSSRLVQPLAGKSLAPVMRADKRAGHEKLFWATSGSRAVREGKWKLVAAPKGDWELYDLEADHTELNDLAGRDPARVMAMSEAFNRWHQVEP